MTITRLGQVTAETGAQGEFSKLRGDTVTLDSVTVRSGSYSWDVGQGAGVGSTFPPQTGVRGNMAVWIDSYDLGAYLMYMHGNGAYTTAMALHADDDEMTLQIADDIVHSTATIAAGFLLGQWNTVGYFYQSGSAGIASVYINGVLWYTHTGDLVGNVDFVVGPYHLNILSQFGGARMDDFYVDAVTSDEEDAAPSDRRFLSSLPINQGVVEWTPVGDTPNYRCIDEAGVPDNDTTYIKTLVGDVQDLYDMGSVVLPTDYHIRAVIPTAVSKKGDSALPATLTPVVFDGLNTAEGDDKTVSLSYRTAWHRFTTQPDGSPWNEADYADMQYGFKASGAF